MLSLFCSIMNSIKEIFNKISSWGLLPEMSHSLSRNIVISNKVSLLISGFTFSLSFIALGYFGLIYSVKLGLVFSIAFLLPLFINRIGHVNMSRVLLSMIVSLSSVIISIIDKFDIYLLEEFQYFEFRLTLLSACVLPFILFKLSERKWWLSALIFNFGCLISYDTIHNILGVGYYQLGLTAPNYPFLNFMFVACFAILVGSTYFLKSSYEKYSHENRLLIKQLSIRQEEILVANSIIENQKTILSQENVVLNRELIEKNNQLTSTNEQLIQHNNDLQQFSYTVSHNLRGPVASLLGLTFLTDKKSLSPENQILFDHFHNAVITLDVTIKDLSNIIDIRNTISKVKQKINLQTSISQILLLLKNDIDNHQAKIEYNFHEGAEIYSVKPMVNSILYNLISNSIKYRTDNRIPHIQIRSKKIESYIKIEVQDNGLGIDVGRFKEKLFGLYKRFHTHVDGKGLGLFLVKLQTESLGGKVELQSELGVGSTFSIYIPDTINPEEQIILDKEWGKLYYDAPRNTTMVIWKRALNVEEFNEFFHRCVEFNNSQLCPNWIVQIQEGTRNEEIDEDLKQARLQFAHEIKRTSLKRLGYVISEDKEPPNFEAYKKQLIEFYQGRIHFFRSIEEAQVWQQRESEIEEESKTTF